MSQTTITALCSSKLHRCDTQWDGTPDLPTRVYASNNHGSTLLSSNSDLCWHRQTESILIIRIKRINCQCSMFCIIPPSSIATIFHCLFVLIRLQTVKIVLRRASDPITIFWFMKRVWDLKKGCINLKQAVGKMGIGDNRVVDQLKLN